MDRLLYATPTGGHPHVMYCASVRALELACRSFGVRGAGDFCYVQAPVQMARSKIADIALTKGYDYVVMHDDDMALHPGEEGGNVGNPLDAWHELMQQRPDVGMIGAVYMRERPQMPNVAVPHPKYPEELCHATHGYPAEPFEVGAIGTGFVMIRVSAMADLADAEFEDGAPPMFRFPMTETRWGMISETGEDYDFCRRLRGCGRKVLADPRVRTVHIKDRGHLVYDYRAWEAACASPGSRVLAEIRSNCPATLKFVDLPNGLKIIDHVGEKESQARSWRERLRKAA